MKEKNATMETAEQIRLEDARTKKIPWKKWGPYLSERQWGTVREDYSENGDAWNFFTHDHARSRAYVPVEFDGVEDEASFIEVGKKKEAYAQKVRKEMRSYVHDCSKMWIYLGQIGEQAAAKEWAVQMKLDAEKGKAAERSMVAEERRMAALDRSESEKERKFEDAQSRASFRSSRNERVYTSRQDQRQYQQTLLNERYTNYYRW
jgi:hypothetical protein